MDKPENTAGRLQTLELSLNEAKDDVANTRSTQGLGGQTISGGGFIRPVAWDFPKGKCNGPATHQPFELRVRVETGETGTAHWLDVYEPQGVYTRFLDSISQNRNAYPSSVAQPKPTAVGDGWYAVTNLDEATFVNDRATLYVVFGNETGDLFNFEFASNNVTETGRIAVGIVSRTVGETTTYAVIQQVVLGAFYVDYAWDGAEAVMTQKDGEWTADLTGVEWTPTTPLILARLYSRTLAFADRPQGPFTLAHPCAEIPLGLEDTLPCFAAKIDATPHAADHIQDFIPFAEEENA